LLLYFLYCYFVNIHTAACCSAALLNWTKLNYHRSCVTVLSVIMGDHIFCFQLPIWSYPIYWRTEVVAILFFVGSKNSKLLQDHIIKNIYFSISIMVHHCHFGCQIGTSEDIQRWLTYFGWFLKNWYLILFWSDILLDVTFLIGWNMTRYSPNESTNCLNHIFTEMILGFPKNYSSLVPIWHPKWQWCTMIEIEK
jgi:hypothetical protein